MTLNDLTYCIGKCNVVKSMPRSLVPEPRETKGERPRGIKVKRTKMRKKSNGGIGIWASVIQGI